MRNSITSYQKANLAGMAEANPYELTAAIFREILGNVAKAKAAMEQGNYGVKGELISKTITLVGVLEGSLDHEQGGEISSNLAALYDYSTRLLFAASADNDPEKLDEVMQILLPIKSAWDAIPPEIQQTSYFAENQTAAAAP